MKTLVKIQTDDVDVKERITNMMGNIIITLKTEDSRKKLLESLGKSEELKKLGSERAEKNHRLQHTSQSDEWRN